jgi:hypothetical protein
MQCDRINELNKILEYNNKGNIFKAIMMVSAGPWGKAQMRFIYP